MNLFVTIFPGQCVESKVDKLKLDIQYISKWKKLMNLDQKV
jgi:hypothetical protein